MSKLKSWIAIGGVAGLGFAIGGPLGGALGAWLGHKLSGDDEDIGEDEDIERVVHDLMRASLFGMLAKMAQADGHVAQSEIEVITDFARDVLKMDEEEKEAANRVFHEALKDDFTIYDYADEFYELFDEDDDEKTREEVYETLFRIAVADGVLSPEEEEILRNLPSHLHISENIFDVLLNKYSNVIRGGVEPRAHKERVQDRGPDEKEAVLAVLYSVLFRDGKMEEWKERWMDAFSDVLEVSWHNSSVPKEFFHDGLEEDLAKLVAKTGRYMDDMDKMVRSMLLYDENALNSWKLVMLIARKHSASVSENGVNEDVDSSVQQHEGVNEGVSRSAASNASKTIQRPYDAQEVLGASKDASKGEMKRTHHHRAESRHLNTLRSREGRRLKRTGNRNNEQSDGDADKLDAREAIMTPDEAREVLGVSRNASKEEVKQAYHRRIEAYHSDALKIKDVSGGMRRYREEQLRRIRKAYDILMREAEKREAESR